MLTSNHYIKCTEQYKIILKIFHKYARTLGFRGWGYFLSSNFNSQKFKVSPGIYLNTCKYNVWGINLERKGMLLHKIGVEKLSSFLLDKYVVYDF